MYYKWTAWFNTGAVFHNYLQKVSPGFERPHPTRQHHDPLPLGRHEGRQHPRRTKPPVLRSPHPVHRRRGLTLSIVTAAIPTARCLLWSLSLLPLAVLPVPGPLAILFISTGLLCRPESLSDTSSGDSTAAKVRMFAYSTRQQTVCGTRARRLLGTEPTLSYTNTPTPNATGNTDTRVKRAGLESNEPAAYKRLPRCT